jgi:hypothetical protein
MTLWIIQAETGSQNQPLGQMECQITTGNMELAIKTAGKRCRYQLLLSSEDDVHLFHICRKI